MNFIDFVMRSTERDPIILEQDLRHLAAYMVKIGTNVDILQDQTRRIRLFKHPELNSDLIQELVAKYKLIWHPNCERQPFDLNNRSLYHIAHNYPNLFIDRAASLTPGGYEERRFWWCANNYHFYLLNLDKSRRIRKTFETSFSPSRLLSDVLCHVLTFDEPKLIAANALHLSVKHSDAQVFILWFERNRSWIHDQLKQNSMGRQNPELKDKLRKLYRIRETEMELNTIHVDLFVEWWNLTGLRR